MNLLSYIISFLIAALFIRLIIRDTFHLKPSLFINLSFATGLGFSGILTYFTFLTFGQFNFWAISGANLTALIILAILFFKNGLHQRNNVEERSHLTLKFPIFDVLIYIFLIFLTCVVFYHANLHPDGEWDAWAMWNLKTKFLLLSQTPWSDILHKLPWHSHPDYPLLLPFINVWASTFYKTYLHHVPLMTCFIFSISCAYLLYSGLNLYIPKRIAIIPTFFILSHPYYSFLATAQYADNIMAYFLLSSIITLTILFRIKKSNIALLCGVLIGLMTFLKNEGIVMSGLLLFITSIYLFTDEKDKNKSIKLIGFLIGGFLITSLPTFIFKVFQAPANHDILPGISLQNLHLFNFNRIRLIGLEIIEEIFDKRWVMLWPFIFVMIGLKFKSFFHKENKVFSFFFIIYFCIITIVYITSTVNDISWWLEYSLRRIFLTVLPSILFLCFYVYWSDQTKPIQNVK